jgi:hypothetical protein
MAVGRRVSREDRDIAARIRSARAASGTTQLRSVIRSARPRNHKLVHDFCAFDAGLQDTVLKVVRALSPRTQTRKPRRARPDR